MTKYADKRKQPLCAAKNANGTQCMKSGTVIAFTSNGPRWMCRQHFSEGAYNRGN
ncbi:hypothetical protein SEA_KABOCHA_109 [Gordonia phage Kabocha]|uniref:Uncharacterized protein n=1 Tax=Gordonia phage Chidiebere TaxID=2656530 RepID=A0A649VLI1_9CAUD|nr:hypothetical protein PQD14_gp108 [Gordonia phage Chidiebere]QGJ92995.1 hypothetical protein PBI_CHIDIEBERE_108 [Gordonia phage Chidiebere]WAA19895.1 hypothetical protein SEA_KABOCHA_109 [Gordonia phage Kabocha]WAA20084.1 hypothetical protein SEA_HANEM_107 [Gordonia phage Hanem]WNM67127.1 hypothetical protein SEA_SCHOMBER_106 [Gordonia Phage Schomber]